MVTRSILERDFPLTPSPCLCHPIAAVPRGLWGPYVHVLQPCPPRGSCAITDRLDGFALFGCRCSYGFAGADCETEVMSPWMRVLAQSTLVLSNVAMLPSFLLCLRLAVRHLYIPGNTAICTRCDPRSLQPKAGVTGVWQIYACFILHCMRALAYLNACKPFHRCRSPDGCYTPGDVLWLDSNSSNSKNGSSWSRERNA